MVFWAKSGGGGIRRYQNKDGSLTPAGRKRYFGEDDQLTLRGQKEYLNKNQVEDLRFENQVFNRTTPGPHKYRNDVLTEYDKRAGFEQIDKMHQHARSDLMKNTRLLKQAGYIFSDNLDSDQKEHNNDLVRFLLTTSSNEYAKANRLETSILYKKWANATLSDLGAPISDDTVNYLLQEWGTTKI